MSTDVKCVHLLFHAKLAVNPNPKIKGTIKKIGGG